MHRLRTMILVLALVALSGAWAGGQDQGKISGRLPANWGKLGLTDEQKQRVYRVQADYKAKIEKLEQQIDNLKGQQQKDMEEVLTDAQKARLREITGKGGGGK